MRRLRDFFGSQLWQAIISVAIVFLFVVGGLTIAQTSTSAARERDARLVLTEQIARESQARSDLAESLAERNRVIVCSITETFLAAPASPTPTPRAEGLEKAFSDARSKDGADCTPDPTDGR